MLTNAVKILVPIAAIALTLSACDYFRGGTVTQESFPEIDECAQQKIAQEKSPITNPHDGRIKRIYDECEKLIPNSKGVAI